MAFGLSHKESVEIIYHGRSSVHYLDPVGAHLIRNCTWLPLMPLTFDRSPEQNFTQSRYNGYDLVLISGVNWHPARGPWTNRIAAPRSAHYGQMIVMSNILARNYF